MNTFVSRTASYSASKKQTKSLDDIRRELTDLSDSQKLAIIGGVVFRIHRKRKLCGNIVPQ